MSSVVNLHHVRDDLEITRDVLAELAADQDVADQCLVEVSVHDGVVQLTGVVGSFAEKCAIERAVGGVVGVRDVRDYLAVRPPGNDQREDHRIETAARCALAWDARVPEGVCAEITDGVVRLEGRASRFSQREAAADAVRNLIGVRDVVNEIRLAPRLMPADLRREVAAALGRRFPIESENIAIAVAGGVVILSGVVSTFAMLDEIERAAGSVLGVRRVDNHLRVA